MQLRTLASGSSGNCILVQHNQTSILIDAGISCKKIITRLKEAGVAPESIAGIFLTHEHSDHIAGLGILLKKYPIPIYCTAGTGAAAARKYPIIVPMLQTFRAGEELTIGDIHLTTFSTPHDAADSVGYRCDAGGRSLAVLTDLGWVPEHVSRTVAGVKLALLEANHDEDWVRCSSYADHLQRRILSDHGHLCNEAGAHFGAFLTRCGAEQLVLAHLSKENNSPDHAMTVVREVLRREGVQPVLTIAPRDELSEVYMV